MCGFSLTLGRFKETDRNVLSANLPRLSHRRVEETGRNSPGDRDQRFASDCASDECDQPTDDKSDREAVKEMLAELIVFNGLVDDLGGLCGRTGISGARLVRAGTDFFCSSSGTDNQDSPPGLLAVCTHR